MSVAPLPKADLHAVASKLASGDVMPSSGGLVRAVITSFRAAADLYDKFGPTGANRFFSRLAFHGSPIQAHGEPPSAGASGAHTWFTVNGTAVSAGAAMAEARAERR